MLYELFISPIKILIEWIFNFLFWYLKKNKTAVITAICGVSLVVNFLALPLYSVADSLQKKERKNRESFQKRLKSIKQTFVGNEKYMMMSAFFRLNNYNPLYALKSSLPILIELPFFIAAYHFLSNCELLKNTGFWIIKDFALADNLLKINSYSINILPVIMTLINFLSVSIYSRDYSLQEKVQLYVIGLVFFVLLYKSPSGLVIYWILNNLFNLGKTLVAGTKYIKKYILQFVAVLVWIGCFYVFKQKHHIKAYYILSVIAVAFLTGLFVLKRKNALKIDFEYSGKTDRIILVFSGIGLAILCGFMIPSVIIASSPSEFSFLGKTASPMAYIHKTFFVFSGFFVVWPVIVFRLFGETVKKYECIFMPILFILVLLNVYVFKSDYGFPNILFTLEDASFFHLTKKEIIIPLILGLSVICSMFFLHKTKFYKNIIFILIAICLAETGIGTAKVKTIRNEFKLISEDSNKAAANIDKEYNLSKENKNVVVFFLDAATSPLVPEIFKEYPEIKKQFNGFVYYPNTVSLANFTVFGTPAMMGGYEYTPAKINARETELLIDKHNEALCVMPLLFADAGFDVRVTDVSLPNYRTFGDSDFYSQYPQIKYSEIGGKYYQNYIAQKSISDDSELDKQCSDGLLDFVTLQCLPPVARKYFYNGARRKFSQLGETMLKQLSNLYYLPQMTDLSSNDNTFTFIGSEVTHDAYVLLDSELETCSDNLQGNSYLISYRINAAALKQIGKWLDYLRQNDVYDNTRIVIVADHGKDVGRKDSDSKMDIFRPVFMVKDFNSNDEIEVSSEFMTNADTLFEAKKGLNLSEVNPLTNSKLIQEKENGVRIFRYANPNENNIRNQKKFPVEYKSWIVQTDNGKTLKWETDK